MLTSQVADRLVELCRKGQFEAAQTELFSTYAISIEPDGVPTEVAEGITEIRAKARGFMSAVEQLHGIAVSEPVVAGDYFTVSMALDTTLKDRGRVLMEELCVYQVVGGKIVTEQFFYTAR